MCRSFLRVSLSDPVFLLGVKMSPAADAFPLFCGSRSLFNLLSPQLNYREWQEQKCAFKWTMNVHIKRTKKLHEQTPHQRGGKSNVRGPKREGSRGRADRIVCLQHRRRSRSNACIRTSRSDHPISCPWKWRIWDSQSAKVLVGLEKSTRVNTATWRQVLQADASDRAGSPGSPASVLEPRT